MVIAPEKLPHMSADELRDVVQSLFQTLTFKQATIDKLTHENAYLKRLKFAASCERYSAEQRSLLEETLDADLQAVSDEIEQLTPAQKTPAVKQQPKRQPLPANLPRTEFRHEPDATTCACGCQMRRIGEDVAEKLDYVPGVFSVERHIRGKWACAQCETLTQAPVEAHIIDKGNHIENQIRPIAIGRNNWLFAGSLRAGKRGAAVISLIQSCQRRLNIEPPCRSNIEPGRVAGFCLCLLAFDCEQAGCSEGRSP